MIKNIGVYIFDNVDLLDVSGPYEVFSTVFLENNQEAFNLTLIAKSFQPIATNSGFKMQADALISDDLTFDLIIIPGGPGRIEEVNKKEVIQWLVKQAKTTQIIASVCTGAFFLAEAGLLDNKTATTHWASLKELQQKYPTIEVVDQVAFVDQDTVITSAGVSSGITMSLYLLEKIHGRKIAQVTAKTIEYPY